jgi:hypothetical protein
MSRRTLLDIFVEGEPPRTAQARLRVFKSRAGRVFLGKIKHKPTEDFLGRLERMARRAVLGSPTPRGRVGLGGDPKPGSEEPVRVTLEFSFPHPSGARKSETSLVVLRTRRPDLDNLAKSTLDAVVRAGVIADDNLVSTLVLRKFNSPSPGLRVLVESDELPLTKIDPIVKQS